MGGQVLSAPKVVTVFFDGDDPAISPQVDAFADALGQSAYWAANTSEYGVGALHHAGTVHLSEAPPATLDDADIQKWLRDKLDADDPAFPTPDANTIYMMAYPSGVKITEGGGTACVDFGAYHESLALDAMHQGLVVPYVVLPRCASIHGLSGIDMVTAGASHELVEAVTDPTPSTIPAYGMLDEDHVYWAFTFGAETGDLCAAAGDAYFKPQGLDYTVQRCWSNQSAAALHDPCVPAPAGKPYFNTSPVLPDLHTTNLFGSAMHSHVVAIPVGQTRSVELDLWSDAATSGPWKVTVEDFATLYGRPKELDIQLDRSTGRNGEKIWADITPVKAASPFAGGFSLFLVRSTLGSDQTIWVGAVVNP
jgi:hypothetical protein